VAAARWPALGSRRERRSNGSHEPERVSGGVDEGDPTHGRDITRRAERAKVEKERKAERERGAQAFLAGDEYSDPDLWTFH
jgi:hypothetical protein